MSDSSLSFNSRRSAVYSTRGMVATSQPLAAHAGVEILMAGGTAADAAVATAAALNVTEPTSTGIGGDMFALFYDAQTRQVTALNGSGRAPSGLSLEVLSKAGFTAELPPLHPFTITVPGACAGWCDLIERHGTKDFSEVLAPAVRLAEDGFPVAPITAYYWARGADRQLKQARGGDQLLISGRAPRGGEIFRNPGLANTFKEVAEGGKEAFYHGAIAEKLVKVVQDSGGVMSLQDLAEHESTWEIPISVDYQGLRIHECPPNGQGLAALLALNILSQFEPLTNQLSAHDIHLIIESLRVAFADASWYVADPAFGSIPLDDILSIPYAEDRAKLIDMDRASFSRQHGVPVASSDTVYLAVIDGYGNACSLINSNYMGFGTGIAPEGTGFTLQNRGHNFSLDQAHPNALKPRKRPYHTIIPAMATTPGGDLYASFGVMGGFIQPQGHVQVVAAMANYGLDPQESLDMPRVCIEPDERSKTVALEHGIDPEVIDKLSAMGHRIQVVSGHERALFGRGQIIRRDSSGVQCGGSDPRADGCAIGF